MKNKSNILLMLCGIISLSFQEVDASSKKSYSMERWENDSMMSDGVMSQTVSKKKSAIPPAAAPLGSAPIPENYDDMDESVSTVEYGQHQARLIDDPQLRPHVRRLYLNITPTSYEELYQQAQDLTTRGMFNRFDGGVWIKNERRLFNNEMLFNLSSTLPNVKKYRISLDSKYRGEDTVELIAETLCGCSYLTEIDLSNCGLNDQQFKEILDVITSLEVEVLRLTDNPLTDRIVPHIERKFKKLAEFYADFSVQSEMSSSGMSSENLKVSADKTGTRRANPKQMIMVRS